MLFVLLLSNLRLLCQIWGHKDLSLYFLLWVSYFQFLHLGYDPLWVNFCIWNEEGIQFHSFCMWWSSWLSTICWRDYSFFIEGCWHHCQIYWIYLWEFVSGLSILFHWSIFLASITLFWLLQLCNKFWIQHVWGSLLTFSFLILLWLFCLLVVPYEFES